MFKRTLVLFIGLALLPAVALAWNGAIMFGHYGYGWGHYPQIIWGHHPQIHHAVLYAPGYLSTVSSAEYSQTINMSKYYNYDYAATRHIHTSKWGVGWNQHLQVDHGLTYSKYISAGSSISSRFGLTATRF